MNWDSIVSHRNHFRSFLFLSVPFLSDAFRGSKRERSKKRMALGIPEWSLTSVLIQPVEAYLASSEWVCERVSEVWPFVLCLSWLVVFAGGATLVWKGNWLQAKANYMLLYVTIGYWAVGRQPIAYLERAKSTSWIWFRIYMSGFFVTVSETICCRGLGEILRADSDSLKSTSWIWFRMYMVDFFATQTIWWPTFWNSMFPRATGNSEGRFG